MIYTALFKKPRKPQIIFYTYLSKLKNISVSVTRHYYYLLYILMFEDLNDIQILSFLETGKKKYDVFYSSSFMFEFIFFPRQIFYSVPFITYLQQPVILEFQNRPF